MDFVPTGIMLVKTIKTAEDYLGCLTWKPPTSKVS